MDETERRIVETLRAVRALGQSIYLSIFDAAPEVIEYARANHTRIQANLKEPSYILQWNGEPGYVAVHIPMEYLKIHNPEALK